MMNTDQPSEDPNHSEGPQIDLADIGWSASLATNFQELAMEMPKMELFPARVAIEEKHGFRIVGAQGEISARCSPGLLRRRSCDGEMPKVGDWVIYDPSSDGGIILGVIPRRSHLTRKVPGRQVREQILAANVDLAVIVHGLDQPVNLRRIERFIVMALEGHVRPVVILNKMDLVQDSDAAMGEARKSAGDAQVIGLSAKTRKGIRELRELIRPGMTAVFLGASGVGKSSLVNALARESLQDTIAVRSGDFKGRHTTTARTLFLLPGGGLVIDTPGLREVHLLASGESLLEAFPEITELSARCKFRDCSHRSEPHCAVKQALAESVLDEGRYHSYLKLRQEVEETAAKGFHTTGLAADRDPDHKIASTRANRKRKRR